MTEWRAPLFFHGTRDTSGTVANTDSKLLIYRLFQKGRVLAQDGELLPKSDILESQLATSLEGRE